jgi:hypothetical protein
MNARSKLIVTAGIRASWTNHSATVVRGALTSNHSAIVVRALTTNHSPTVVRGGLTTNHSATVVSSR